MRRVRLGRGSVGIDIIVMIFLVISRRNIGVRGEELIYILRNNIWYFKYDI